MKKEDILNAVFDALDKYIDDYNEKNDAQVAIEQILSENTVVIDGGHLHGSFEVIVQ